MAKVVYCLADSDMQAETIMDQLRTNGYSNSDISVLWPDANDRFGLGATKATKAPEGATTGATSGGVVGGILGWLAGIGLLAIPGLGPFVAAGPIMAALSGAAIGATTGGLLGALIGMGIPEYEAKRYEEGLRNGKVLISCRATDGDNAKRIEQMFKDANATDIYIGNEKDRDMKDRSNDTMVTDRDDTVRTDIYTSPSTDVHPHQGI